MSRETDPLDPLTDFSVPEDADLHVEDGAEEAEDTSATAD